MDQITNIAIKIGEINQKADEAVAVAIIGAIAAVVAAIIAGYFKWKINDLDKKHQKQWSYITKRSELINAATDIFARMLFNKLLIAHKTNESSTAAANLFLLQKDILVVESQLVIYSTLEIVDAVFDFKNLIINTPDSEFFEIYQKGGDYLILCRKHLGVGLEENFDDFIKKITAEPGLNGHGQRHRQHV